MVARAQGQLTSCKSNLKNQATALEMYSTDHEGTYPAGLAELTPNYLKVIPNCPAAKRPTYSYQVHAEPSAFTLFCQGSHHQKANTPADYPQYSSLQGLVER